MSTVSALNLTNDKLPKVIFIILELFIGLEKFKFRLGLNTCLLDTDYVRRNFQASFHAGFNFFWLTIYLRAVINSSNIILRLNMILFIFFSRLKLKMATDSFLTWMVVAINNNSWHVGECSTINYQYLLSGDACSSLLGFCDSVTWKQIKWKTKI